MKSFQRFLCLALLIPAPFLCAQNVKISNFGWTITANPDRAELTISHDRLGPVLQAVHLESNSQLPPSSSPAWNAQALDDHTLSILTHNPAATWLITLSPDQVRFSTTSAQAAIRAQAPASPQRIVARLVDPAGTPVVWSGTGEVAVAYGGSFTRNPSFLPRRNPDVAYFALGQVSASGLHSLFDRPTDIALDFSQDASLTRNAHDATLLDVSIPVPGNTLLRIIPDYFTKVLGVPFYVPYDDAAYPSAPMVWSSWTSYYEQVKEDDIVQNADWLSKYLRPYGFQFVQLDDGYDRGPHDEHYWITRWNQQKFPHGPKWLADYIRSQGLRPGIWLVPNSQAEFVAQHPDWYLYYKSGKIVLDYNTPALDSSNPAVLDFLSHEFATLKDWGYEYYKLDGEHALPKYIPNVDLTRLYDHTTDPVSVYRHRLSVIRKSIGPDAFVEGDIAGTPLNGIGYINSFFNGDDLYDNWQGMYALFSSINANSFFNHIVAYTMPGEGMALEPQMSLEEGSKKRNPTVLGTLQAREYPLTGFGTSTPEARTVVSFVALTGVVYSLGSVMSELPEERVELLRQTLPTMPIFPIDLFSRGTDMSWDRFKSTTPDTYIHNYPEVLDLKVNSAAGNYDVVALTNWRSWPATRNLSLHAQLGLPENSQYVVFDFWNAKLLGVFQGTLAVDVPPHDTRVLAVHPVAGNPQLVGISRHITGAYSVLGLHWDASSNTLSGSSQTVPGHPYLLYIYVPDNFKISAAAIEDHPNLTPTFAQQGQLLTVTLPAQPDPLRWKLTFHSTPK